MENNNIPTTEELFKKYSNLYQFEEGPNEYLIDKEDFSEALIEFAKLHVAAALKSASENAKVSYSQFGDMEVDGVNKDSILNSYPLDNIK